MGAAHQAAGLAVDTAWEFGFAHYLLRARLKPIHLRFLATEQLAKRQCQAPV
jgi:hypothetical protein